VNCSGNGGSRMLGITKFGRTLTIIAYGQYAFLVGLDSNRDNCFQTAAKVVEDWCLFSVGW
jgi:hypothetical protein